MTALPGISIAMATLNADRYLEGCLISIREQNYPSDLIELIVADAGSIDRTLELLSRYKADRVVPNPGITTESARAILNRVATRELILYLDSDNYLVGKDWLRRMVQPLQDDATVFAAEPLRFDYSRSDPPLNRYFALSGVNDPLSIFIGNYSRYSYITGKWTGMPHSEETHDGYIVAQLIPGHVPTMGSQGFLVRADIVREVSQGDYYFDIDGPVEMVAKGHCRIAKVNTSLGHIFARDLPSLRRKIRRRIDDFLYWRELRTYPWLSSGRGAMARFVLSTVLIVPLIWQAFRGWRRVRDWAWAYHIPVCLMTLYVYAWAVAVPRRNRSPYSRKGWQH